MKEAEIKEGTSGGRSEVLEGKRLALFEKLILDAVHQDILLVQDRSNWFTLAGDVPRFKGHFNVHVKRGMSPEDRKQFRRFKSGPVVVGSCYEGGQQRIP